MTYHEILKRYTGFSSPIYGLQWDASDPVIEVAGEVIRGLETREVLYDPIDVDARETYVESVGDIRDQLGEALPEIEYQSPLDTQIRKMRRGAQRFVDEVGHPGFDRFAGPVQASVLRQELQRLRETVGEAVAEISISHGVEVDGELASIIPFNNLSGK